MFCNRLRLFRRVILPRRLEMSCCLSMGSFQSRPKRAHDDTVEAVVCRENDLEESQMKVCQLGDAGRVLVVKHQGRIYAVGNKCSHYGAPLDRGVFHNGRIRCPWHGACFNVATGDIEDFPGLDGIPSYSVKVADDGAVRVRARKHDVQSSRVCKAMVKRSADNKNTVLVLGGGGAGASCVESLRQSGFTGRLLLATRERHLPYDRPKLSKVLDMTADKLALRSPQFYESCDVEVLTNHEASSVDIAKRSVCFTNNTELNYTKLIIATGSRPRRLEVSGADLDGLFTLRSPDDGNKIAARLPGKRVVIVGSGFIGMEAAAYCVDKASSVTVVGFGAVPFERALGARIGTMLQALHQSKGVVIRNNLSAKKFRGAHGKLTHVVLSDDSEMEADLCLMGVGVLPCTEFLHKSSVSLDQRGYIVVDKHLRSSCADVYAAGDVASFPLSLAGGELVTIGHWQMAHQLGRVAAHNVAGKDTAVNTVPFFWTQMFGKSLRYAGYAAGFDDIVYDGDVESQQFVAYFCRGDRVCAVASMGRDPVVAHWAEQMAAHGLPSLHAVQQYIQKTQ